MTRTRTSLTGAKQSSASHSSASRTRSVIGCVGWVLREVLGLWSAPVGEKAAE